LPQLQGRGLVPLDWRGRAVIATFILAMLLGAGLFLYFGLRDQFAIGIPLFVVLAIAGGGFFIWASAAKTDPLRTIYDYRPEMRRPAPAAGQATGDKN
jgi:hypothetical protein